MRFGGKDILPNNGFIGTCLDLADVLDEFRDFTELLEPYPRANVEGDLEGCDNFLSRRVACPFTPDR